MSRGGRGGAGGAGTGYNLWFHCPVARRDRDPETHSLPKGHEVVRTGRTRKAPSPGRGHPRKLSLSHEYVCSCSHVGWTCHVDIIKRPLQQPALEATQ